MTAAALEVVRRHAPGFVPKLALIAGSGLAGLADGLSDVVAVSYAELPGFPQPTVSGHAGRLLLGNLAETPVAVMLGRAHGYEGGGYAAMATAIRALKALGAESLLLTCAAGALNPDLPPGRLAAISDHINLFGFSPLVGPNDDGAGPRFPDMTAAWDPGLRAMLAKAAAAVGVELGEGVYAAVPGPNFETPAEVRMLRLLGADLVGMSTAPECVLARHCGLRVAGIAAVVNHGAGMAGAEDLSHEQTLAAARGCGADLARLLPEFCRLSRASA